MLSIKNNNKQVIKTMIVTIIDLLVLKPWHLKSNITMIKRRSCVVSFLNHLGLVYHIYPSTFYFPGKLVQLMKLLSRQCWLKYVQTVVKQ